MTQAETEDRIAAVDWVIRLRDPAFADWDVFTVWLEAAPHHAALYDHAALADRDIGDMLAPTALPASSNDNAVPLRGTRRRAWAGWSAAAAAIMVAVGSYPLLDRGDSTYAVATAPGEQRTVTLADGTRIEMNGGSRLTLHRADTRLASLDSGEATFSVVHDAARPFTVETGGDRIQDVGTIFNVARGADTTEVGVAEGAILYNPGGEAVQLKAGQTLRVSSREKRIVLGTAAPASIGTWRHGRLVYRDARIAQVAADVSRYLGVTVTADPTVASRTFDGVIILDRDPRRLLARLAPLLDVAARPSEQGWRLTALDRETR